MLYFIPRVCCWCGFTDTEYNTPMIDVEKEFIYARDRAFISRNAKYSSKIYDDKGECIYNGAKFLCEECLPKVEDAIIEWEKEMGYYPD